MVENILYVIMPIAILIIGLHIRIESRIVRLETDVKWLVHNFTNPGRKEVNE